MLTISEMPFYIYVACLFFLISMERLSYVYSNPFSVFLSHNQEMEGIDRERSQRQSQLKVGQRRRRKRKMDMQTHLLG